MKTKIFLAGLLAAFVPLHVTAHQVVYTALLSGEFQSPTNASPGAGIVKITLDFDLFNMRVEASFANLQGTVTSAHIHAATAAPLSGTAGIATQTPTLEAFPTGVTSGSYDHTIDLTQASAYNPDFIAANGGTVSTASNALFAALAQSKAYFDIHTTAFSDGEVRGFLIRPPPMITSVAITGGAPTITFTTVDESSYRVERKDDLNEAMWTTVTDADNVVGTGDVVSVSDPDAGAASLPRRSYRVVLYFP